MGLFTTWRSWKALLLPSRLGWGLPTQNSVCWRPVFPTISMPIYTILTGKTVSNRVLMNCGGSHHNYCQHFLTNTTTVGTLPLLLYISPQFYWAKQYSLSSQLPTHCHTMKMRHVQATSALGAHHCWILLQEEGVGQYFMVSLRSWDTSNFSNKLLQASFLQAAGPLPRKKFCLFLFSVWTNSCVI